MTAWCNATSAFLQSCGAAAVPSPVGARKSLYSPQLLTELATVSYQGALHRPAKSALQHYQITRQRVKNLVLNAVRSFAGSSQSTSFNHTPHLLRPSDASASPASSTARSLPPSEDPATPASSTARSLPPSEDSATPASSTNSPCKPTARNGCSSSVQSNAMDSKWTAHCGPPEDHEPRDGAPSYYLNQKCPLCFPLETPDVFTRYRILVIS